MVVVVDVVVVDDGVVVVVVSRVHVNLEVELVVKSVMSDHTNSLNMVGGFAGFV